MDPLIDWLIDLVENTLFWHRSFDRVLELFFWRMRAQILPEQEPDCGEKTGQLRCRFVDIGMWCGDNYSVGRIMVIRNLKCFLFLFMKSVSSFFSLFDACFSLLFYFFSFLFRVDVCRLRHGCPERAASHSATQDPISGAMCATGVPLRLHAVLQRPSRTMVAHGPLPLSPLALLRRVGDCALSIDWLIDWSLDWLIGWLIDWLIDWLIAWSLDWSIDWLIDWLFFSVPYIILEDIVAGQLVLDMWSPSGNLTSLKEFLMWCFQGRLSQISACLERLREKAREGRREATWIVGLLFRCWLKFFTARFSSPVLYFHVFYRKKFFSSSERSPFSQ